jgi:hypothetical protein
LAASVARSAVSSAVAFANFSRFICAVSRSLVCRFGAVDASQWSALYSQIRFIGCQSNSLATSLVEYQLRIPLTPNPSPTYLLALREVHLECMERFLEKSHSRSYPVLHQHVRTL